MFSLLRGGRAVGSFCPLPFPGGHATGERGGVGLESKACDQGSQERRTETRKAGPGWGGGRQGAGSGAWKTRQREP